MIGTIFKKRRIFPKYKRAYDTGIKVGRGTNLKKKRALKADSGVSKARVGPTFENWALKGVGTPLLKSSFSSLWLLILVPYKVISTNNN